MHMSPWNRSDVDHGILQLYLGYNPISKLEVVSLLNIPSQAHEMYYYNTGSCLVKYNPKVYLGTLQSIAYWWLCNRETDWILDSNTTPKLTWPQAFQTMQKGEANTR